MSLTNSPFWMAQTGGAFYGYEIDGSLRFDNTGYLTRTNGTPTDEDVWTFSAWVKRSGTASTTGSDAMLGAGQYPGNNNSIRFSNDEGDDELIIFNGGSGQNKGYKRSTSLYRDNSGWYHVCVSRSGGTIAMEVNGVSVDIYTQVGFDAGVNSQNSSGYTHYVGASERALTPYSGYMAEVNFIDGQALAASYFGETKSGIWIPKEYSGSYGNNGYQLKFNGNANDSSGNGNNFSSTNISSHDYVPDSPTNNWSTLEGIQARATYGMPTLSEGNLQFGSGGISSSWGYRASNMEVSSGKWYAECRTSGNTYAMVGVFNTGYYGESHFLDQNPQNNTGGWMLYMDGATSTNTKFDGSTASASFTDFNDDDIMGIALDADNGTVKFYVNGTLQTGFGTGGTVDISEGTGDAFRFWSLLPNGSGTTFRWNFGQDSTFVGTTTAGGNADDNGYGDFKYAPPSGYLALCSANLPAPAIDPADDDIPADYFDVVLYTAATSNGTYTAGNLSFRPDFTWIKNRDNIERHFLIDVVRGNTSITNKFLVSNSNAAEGSNGTDGTTFSVTDTGYEFVETTINSGELYFNGRTYVGWNWKAGGTGVSNTDGSITSTVSANTDAGFSVVTWTGTAGSDTIGHGLGTAPSVIITKPLSGDNWIVYHKDMGATKQVYLDLTNSQETNSNIYSVVPTSSVFTIGSWSSTRNLVSYCFAEKEGYSKFGSYTGNGSSDGTFVYTGFRPAFILFKCTGLSTNWEIYDTTRQPDNIALAPLYANLVNVEEPNTTLPALDILSNGFKPRSTWDEFNRNGSNYIYLAFAEQPFKYANAR